MNPPLAASHKRRWAAAAALAGLALVLLAFSFLVKAGAPADPSPASIERLRRTAAKIREEFRLIMDEEQGRMERLTSLPFPADPEAGFALLRSLTRSPDVEGVALAEASGKPTLWIGNALDTEELVASAIEPPSPSDPPVLRLVRSKASAFLVLLRRTREGGHAAVFRLLSFHPQFKSRYLEEYEFLPAVLRAGAKLEYFDFRDDVSSYERFFGRNKDEYIGQPRLQGRIQSFFFPLRDLRGHIVATVNVTSPPPDVQTRKRADALRLISGILFLLALVLAGVTVFRSDSFLARPRAPAWLLFLAVLAAFRTALLFLGRLEGIAGLTVFSPARAGFRSFLGLTRSPADIFFTALCFFAAAVSASIVLLKRPRSEPRGLFRTGTDGIAAFAAILAAGASYPLFGRFLGRVVRDSNINLLEFPLDSSFALIVFGILLAWTGIVALQAALLKPLAQRKLPGWILAAFFIGAETLVFLALGPKPPGTAILAVAALAALAWILAGRTGTGRKTIVAAAFLAQVLFLYASLNTATAAKGRILAQGFIRENVLSLESWARFLVQDSVEEIDRGSRALADYLKNPDIGPAMARRLWERTLPAKFNWYSGLEILAADGAVLSSFALNVPGVIRPAAALPAAPEWRLSRISVPFMGKEREFLTAVKDISDRGVPLGRIALSLSLDPEALPFLYSSNPYFELLRVTIVPSLRAFDLRFAVFDKNGTVLFNPHKLSTGLPASLLVGSPSQGRWSRFADKGRNYSLFSFAEEGRVYAVLVPRPTWRSHIVGVIKLAVLAALTAGWPLLALAWGAARRRGRRVLWSFSDRVYLSFMVVALVPLVLFAFASRAFTGRLFAQQFVEKAAIQAEMARSVTADFFALQREDPQGLSAQPEDLVLLISNTIGNDVNLYQDGRLVSSSRREFFDAGLLPELLDGEVYYRLRYENNPYIAKERRIGAFGLRTLTIPYNAPESRLFFALPFPFEQQDVAVAARDFLEFLVFIAVIFIAVVLLMARGIGSMIVTPVRRLLAGTREASLGNLEIAIPYERSDEMRTLVDGFNTMIRSLKQHQQELAELGRKAAWAEMARKVAHEIKNPLTPIQLSAEHLLRVYEDGRGDLGPALRESISYIVGEVENLRHIAQDFLELGREPLLQKETIDVVDLVRETVEPYRRLLAERIVIREEYPAEPAMVVGDRSKLKIALRNLLTNAIESIRGAGEIRVRVEREPAAVAVVVVDTGAGMKKEVLARVFEPYFSTKEAGTGLGLPIVQKIAEDHGGSIRIESRPGSGTSARLLLPAPRS